MHILPKTISNRNVPLKLENFLLIMNIVWRMVEWEVLWKH